MGEQHLGIYQGVGNVAMLSRSWSCETDAMLEWRNCRVSESMGEQN